METVRVEDGGGYVEIAREAWDNVYGEAERIGREKMSKLDRVHCTKCGRVVPGDDARVIEGVGADEIGRYVWQRYLCSRCDDTKTEGGP